MAGSACKFLIRYSVKGGLVINTLFLPLMNGQVHERLKSILQWI
jgi:hypothetical protein